MIKRLHSKRAFIKKMAALAGFVAAADYTGRLISVHSDALATVNDNSANDVKLQARMLQNKQLVPMTSDEKNRALEEILNRHDKHRA